MAMNKMRMGYFLLAAATCFLFMDSCIKIEVTEPDLPPPTPVPGGRYVPIGLNVNIFANQEDSTANRLARFQQALDAGITFMGNANNTWADVEPKPGEYKFNDLDFWAQLAEKHKMPMAYNIRFVDTNNRPIPQDLQGCTFRDPRLRERLLALIDALAPRLKGRAQWVMIGNEVDGYFNDHRNEVPDYVELFKEGSKRLKTLMPGVQVATTITFGGLSGIDSYLKPLVEECDFLALTYYPLNPDFTFRSPDSPAQDFPQMIRSVKGKKILMQEIGFSSSPLNQSSGAKQARFIGNVFNQVETNSDVFIGVSFFLMSDFSDALVNTFGEYYRLPGVERFKSFLKTLGMFDDQGNPKPAWSAFQERASRMKAMKPS